MHLKHKKKQMQKCPSWEKQNYETGLFRRLRERLSISAVRYIVTSWLLLTANSAAH